MSDPEEGTFAWTDMGWGPQYRWRYRKLSESEISSQLGLYANAEFNSSTSVASVTFQPCLNEDERSQDRRVVESWDFGYGPWSFTAVFDGHAGHETVDHAMVELPALIKRKIHSALNHDSSLSAPDSQLISSIISDAIVDYDKSLLADLSALFPGGLDGISTLSSGEIENIINDAHRGGKNLKIVHRCMRGSTALIALVDPSAENLWIANLGDCRAVLGTKNSDGKWETRLLTSDHNGSNQGEVGRVRDEHPHEPECILNRRVLGALAVTRALGDFEFKLPAHITENVFLRANPGFSFKMASIYDWIGRNLTPPYVSHQPEVQHHRIIKGRDAFLLMCSDGLPELLHRGFSSVVDPGWAEILGPIVARGARGNAALALLREALGGYDLDEVSKLMTLESTERWIDDTTIIVQKLGDV